MRALSLSLSASVFGSVRFCAFVSGAMLPRIRSVRVRDFMAREGIVQLRVCVKRNDSAVFRGASESRFVCALAHIRTNSSAVNTDTPRLLAARCSLLWLDV